MLLLIKMSHQHRRSVGSATYFIFSLVCFIISTCSRFHTIVYYELLPRICGVSFGVCRPTLTEHCSNTYFHISLRRSQARLSQLIAVLNKVLECIYGWITLLSLSIPCMITLIFMHLIADVRVSWD